ncbi:MAG: type IV-A pilus assembly ATPase PilB [Methylococcaceae bacterium]|nr:type IV-A pilus assembly ATPase PilB [Methylococcaceae bacterium]
MATATKPTLPLSGLTKCLVQDGLLNEVDARKHLEDAQRDKVSLISYLVAKKLVNAGAVASLASLEFGLPLLDLNAIDLTAIPLDLVNEKLIEQHHVLPLYKRGNKLFVATSDPANPTALDEIKFNTRLNTEAILVEEDKLTKAIEKALEAADTSMDDLDDDLANLEVADEDETAGGAIVPGAEADEAPVVKFVNKVLLDAIKKGVSDLHFEPYEKIFRIRFRGDGMLYEYARPPMSIANRLVSRIKVMSKLDIAERRVPQDGRIKLKLSKTKAIDFRVSSCPTLFGEKIVMRILDPTSAEIGVEKLGFEPAQQELFINAINRPYGMVLVTGPTGSGKTVSLYTGLNIINTIDRNISTAEDPVEITVEGINQVNVNPKAGLTFAAALKSFLRQDPDVIMIGEIRDFETGSIGIKAAQTGHMVLSTLHTNDAPQTINRLMQMGIEPFNIVAAVNLVMAQRLARRLCQNCKKVNEYPEGLLLDYGFTEEELEEHPIYQAVGCDACTGGYKGRVGMYQVMPMTEKIKALILAGGNAMELADLAKKEGVNDLRTSGMLKVMQGITTIEEIDRVTEE